jgi:phosphohistidine phosphatase SixA
VNRRLFTTLVFGASLLACNKPTETATSTPEAPEAPEAALEEAEPEAEEEADPVEAMKTVYIVRHAEKQKIEGERDPDLTEEGHARAAALKEQLAAVKIDAVYSTDYKRTQHTVAPVAEAVGLEITSYDPSGHPKDFAEVLRSSEATNILVAGHSNTVPALLGAFGAQVEPIDDSQYGDLFVLTIDGDDIDVSIERFGN